MSARIDNIALIKRDIQRLNNIDLFQNTFSALNILEILTTISSKECYEQRQHEVSKFLRNLQDSGYKSVYIVLKWLICVHEIINSIECCEVFDEMMNGLSRMQRPFIKNKHDQYFYNKVIKPYQQYLNKLCFLKHQLLIHANNTSQQGEQFSFKHSTSPKSIDLLFMEYNLAGYVCRSFQNHSKEFYNFLAEYYPFLNRYLSLLHHDLQLLIQSVRNAFQTNKLHSLTFFQIQGLELSLEKFQIRKELQVKGKMILENTNENSKNNHSTSAEEAKYLEKTIEENTISEFALKG